MDNRIIKYLATNGMWVDDMDTHRDTGSHYTEFDIHRGEQATTIQIEHDKYDNIITVDSYGHGPSSNVDCNQMSIALFVNVEPP